MIDKDTAKRIVYSHKVLYDIGQLEPDTKYWLNREVRSGHIIRAKAPWRGFGLVKTCYYVPPVAL